MQHAVCPVDEYSCSNAINNEVYPSLSFKFTYSYLQSRLLPRGLNPLT